jgi:ribokinase
MSKILVIGSSNTDLIARVKRFAVAGETIEGSHFMQAMGGKGANQALAAHKLGGDVKFITSLGSDSNGENTLKYFKNIGLDASASLIVDSVPSGTAMIWVDENGENCIVITPGANKELSPEYIIKMKNEIAAADIVVMQMEIPYETVKTVCDLAHNQGKIVMLNVAPACKLDHDLIGKVDVLIVNETEAETIADVKIDEIGEEPMVDRLRELGAKTVVLTLGKRGSILKNGKESYKIPAFVVETLDSTAAGDTFCGALAAELSKGHKWEQALRFATASAAICVTRMGAQPSIPTEREVDEFLNKNAK